MRKRNLIALGIFVSFYVSFGAYLTFNQERIIYQPFPQNFQSCPGFAQAKKVNHQGTRMYVNLKENQPTAVLYHGNAGSACDRDFYANLFSEAGHGYIVVEYAGYSNDTREPSHELVKRDVRNVISYLEEHDIPSVSVVGESIGAGVAAYHASLSSPEKMLLISPFTDLKAMASNRFWFYPTSLLVDNAFDNVAALKDYSGQITIVHGTEDRLIPYKFANELHQSLSGNKEIIPIEGAGHNNLFTYEKTHQAISDFLKGTP